MKNYILTIDEHTIFKNEVLKWLNYFGIKDWHITFTFEDCSKSIAHIEYNMESRLAVFNLSKIIKHFENESILELIKRAAFHEVLELLFSPYYEFATTDHSVNEREFEIVNHAIIRTLENTIYEDSIEVETPEKTLE